MSAMLRTVNVRQMALVKHTEEVDALIADAIDHATKFKQLEQNKQKADRELLETVFALSLEIRDWMDRDNIKAAEVARRLQIKSRDAQRMRRLADRVTAYRAKIAEAEHQDNLVYPHWRSLVPEPRDTGDTDDLVEARKLAIGREIATELLKGRKADQAKLASFERELERLRQADATVTIEPIDETALLQELQQLRRENAERGRIISTQTAEIAQLRERNRRWGKMGRGNPEIETPWWLFDFYDRQFHFTCDAAASGTNRKHPENYWTKQDDALTKEWCGVIWCNPPWNNIGPFVKKAYEEAQRGATVVMLVPLWGHADWFIQYASHAEIRILDEGVAFVGFDLKYEPTLCVLIFTKGSCKSPDGSLRVVHEKIRGLEKWQW
jgi:phage N-6-adenine-methyltransferase